MSLFIMCPKSLAMAVGFIYSAGGYSDTLPDIRTTLATLIQANYYSVCGRYGDEYSTDEIEIDVAVAVDFADSPKANERGFWQSVKTLKCYEYQTSDWHQYDTSDAKDLVNALISRAINAAPEYNAAIWN